MSDFDNVNDFDDFDNEDGMEQIITMLDDDGNEVDFVVVDACECDGVNYILVVESEFVDDEEAEAEILKEVKVEGEESYYKPIEDDAEFEKAAALFQNGNEEYDIEL